MKLKEKLKIELQRLKDEFGKAVAAYAERHPTLSFVEIAETVGIFPSEVSTYCKLHGVVRERGGAAPSRKNR
jgi:hypothetical protein